MKDTSTVQIDIKVDNEKLVGKHNLRLEVNLKDYPAIKTSADLSVTIKTVASSTPSKPYFDKFPLYFIIQEGDPWFMSLPRPRYDLIDKSGNLIETVVDD
jgi:hypothetical protein